MAVKKTSIPKSPKANSKGNQKKKVSKPKQAKKNKKQTKKGSLSKLNENLKLVLLNLLWNRYTKSLLMLCAAVLFLYGFYCAFIRPSAYRWMPCYGNKSYGVCMPKKHSLHGIDVSRHQGKIDWDTLMGNSNPDFPLTFVFVKATEGGDFKDVNFDANFCEAKRVNLRRGAYHFFTPKTSATKQAQHYMKTVKLQKGDLPPVLDVEILGDKSKQDISDSVLVWMNIIEKHYKVKPILYTSFKFKNRYLDATEFDQYPFWIAHYYVGKLRYTGKWTFWQHSDIGRIKGINQDVDLNVFNGTIEELNALTIR